MKPIDIVRNLLICPACKKGGKTGKAFRCAKVLTSWTSEACNSDDYKICPLSKEDTRWNT